MDFNNSVILFVILCVYDLATILYLVILTIIQFLALSIIILSSHNTDIWRGVEKFVHNLQEKMSTKSFLKEAVF